MLGLFAFGRHLALMSPTLSGFTQPVLPWLAPGEPFPPIHTAWPADSSAPGLLAAGGALDVDTLTAAYTQGIFPWFSADQPILWWSTAPRMVLLTSDFVLSNSLRKQLKRMLKLGTLELRFDTVFERVIRACANSPRTGQAGTWITEDMIDAYTALHHAGRAHSVEAWVDGKLAGGLYAVSVGRMVYGESMFCDVSNASKMALAGLVAHCRANDLPAIDCQQQTPHLASLGAQPVSREIFQDLLATLTRQPCPNWSFDPACWHNVLGAAT